MKILEIVGIVVLVGGAVILSSYIGFGRMGSKLQKIHLDTVSKVALKIPELKK